MPAAKGQNSESPANVRKRLHLPSQEPSQPHRQKIRTGIRVPSLESPLDLCECPYYLHVVQSCVPAHLSACFLQRVSGSTLTVFSREGFGVRRHPPFICSCAFWACLATRCRSPVLFSYEGPAVFALYLRMRSVALLLMPIVFLWEANLSSFYGMSIWAYCYTDYWSVYITRIAYV